MKMSEREGVKFYKKIETEYAEINIYVNLNVTKEESDMRLKRYLVAKYKAEGKL